MSCTRACSCSVMRRRRRRRRRKMNSFLLFHLSLVSSLLPHAVGCERLGTEHTNAHTQMHTFTHTAHHTSARARRAIENGTALADVFVTPAALCVSFTVLVPGAYLTPLPLARGERGCHGGCGRRHRRRNDHSCAVIIMKKNPHFYHFSYSCKTHAKT